MGMLGLKMHTLAGPIDVLPAAPVQAPVQLLPRPVLPPPSPASTEEGWSEGRASTPASFYQAAEIKVERGDCPPTHILTTSSSCCCIKACQYKSDLDSTVWLRALLLQPTGHLQTGLQYEVLPHIIFTQKCKTGQELYQTYTCTYDRSGAHVSTAYLSTALKKRDILFDCFLMRVQWSIWAPCSHAILSQDLKPTPKCSLILTWIT